MALIPGSSDTAHGCSDPALTTPTGPTASLHGVVGINLEHRFQRHRLATHFTVQTIKVRGRRHPEHGGSATISAAVNPHFTKCGYNILGTSVLRRICPRRSAVVIHHERRFRDGPVPAVVRL